MKWTLTVIAMAFIILSMASASETVYAEDRVITFRVTITNITRGQTISPPLVFSHKRNFHFFELGDPASQELATLAEDGNPVPLEMYLDGLDSVYDTRVAEGGIMPGQSDTIDIDTKKGFRYLSAAGMLISSNDAFFAINRVYARSWGNTVVNARAYDSGSEVNSENCAFIPGPPCGNGGVRDTEGAEGYVYVHSGIHGIGGLASDVYDWRNPVAMITIERLK